jgi:hypothetical protein
MAIDPLPLSSYSFPDLYRSLPEMWRLSSITDSSSHQDRQGRWVQYTIFGPSRVGAADGHRI